MEQGIQHGVFAVCDQAHCVWAWDLAKLKHSQRNQVPLRVTFYDAAAAHVWGCRTVTSLGNPPSSM